MSKEVAAEILNCLIDHIYQNDTCGIFDCYAKEDVLDALSIAKIKVGK